MDEVRPVAAAGAKPYTLYMYELDPYPSFLVNGHPTRAPLRR
ncbi:hypothetical protein ACFU99_13545 [Streptomyces sp. NPDC057654]